ncbi:hypothetical protein BRARA_H00608, partial [Brassica rapa]
GESKPIGWIKPTGGYLKCNIGSSWIGSRQPSGASWFLRNDKGRTIMHSRRSYSFMRSKTEADLWALHWAVKCMKNTHQTKVIFEASSEQIWEVLCNQAQFPGFRSIVGMINNQLTRIEIWSLDYALPKRNEAANAIAVSVTRDRRH